MGLVTFAVISAIFPLVMKLTLNAARVDPAAIQVNPLRAFAEEAMARNCPGKTAVHNSIAMATFSLSAARTYHVLV